ncbi:MAG: hypothetical protein R2867_33410 [Caldilineaceae bacterium]
MQSKNHLSRREVYEVCAGCGRVGCGRLCSASCCPWCCSGLSVVKKPLVKLPQGPDTGDLFQWTAGGEVEGLNNHSDLQARLSRCRDHQSPPSQHRCWPGGDERRHETCMMGGELPESFQVHLGRELIDSHVIAGRMEPLDDPHANRKGTTTSSPPT